MKLPSIMKRNARYRGHRESEKYLSDRQECIAEIRNISKEINGNTNMQQQSIASWFHGGSQMTVGKFIFPSIDGIFDIRGKMQELDERLGGVERSLKSYENAYK